MRTFPRSVLVPPKARKAGLAYAFDDDGLEHPVIDITHPAFALAPTEAELDSRVEAALEYMRGFSSRKSFARRAVFSLLAGRSRLVRSIGAAGGGCVGGLAMYRLKLGPENLGPGWATAMDRSVAGSLPSYSARLRLRDTAVLVADACAAALDSGGVATSDRPLRLINVAGGAAMDSLNALILLRGRGLLEGRRIRIDVLDPDPTGPAFASRALAALKGRSLPLEGLDAALVRVDYDWRNVASLRDIMRSAGEEGAACILSSEGGLFEYAADEDIAANLRAAREGLSEGRGESAAPAWAGTASRVAGKAAFLNGASGAKVRLRPLSALEAVAESEGYRLTRSIDCPLSTSFVLEAAAT